MLEIHGKYSTAIVYTDNVDFSALEQIKNLVNCSVFQNQKIRIMPDVHAGMGCVVGYTQELTNGKAVVNLVGCDLSCGMSYVKIPHVDVKQLDKVIHQFVPAGFEIHKPGKLDKKIVRRTEDILNKLTPSFHDELYARLMNSAGTLGGGGPKGLYSVPINSR